MKVVELKGLEKSYGKLRAVDKVDLTVEAGEIFGLVGPDGAGKTTMIRMIVGVQEIGGGESRVLDETEPEKIKHRIGYVPQKFSLYGDLTVIENIRLMGALYGASKERIETMAREILDFTNLLPFQDRLADHLSGGMKQKLALAAGLMHRPEIFFLDEPTTGVDPVSRREFWQMLYKLNQENGMTVLVSTPYMDEAELCHRVAFMHGGRIVACDSPRNLKKAYPHKVLEITAAVRGVQEETIGLEVWDVHSYGDKHRVVLDDPETVGAVLRQRLEAKGVTLGGMEEVMPTMEDVFVLLANEVIG